MRRRAPLFAAGVAGAAALLALAIGPRVSFSGEEGGGEDAAPAAPPAAAPPAPAAPAAPPAKPPAWLDDPGTAVLGLGLLHVAPERSGAPGTVTISYEEKPADYGAFDAVQLMVLASDAFATSGRATGADARAFARSPGGGGEGAWRTSVRVEVDEPTLFVVGYGPFVGPDTGRPLTLARAYDLRVEGAGAAWRWVDTEAGELNVKGWTNRPDVSGRGEPATDATGAKHWFEVRPLVVFDRERVRAPGDPEAPEVAAAREEAAALDARAKTLEAAGKADVAAEVRSEAEGLRCAAASLDPRLPLPAALAAKLRRLPFRWK